MINLRKDAFPHVLLGTENRRFVCEPSVLCSALGKTAGAQRDNRSAEGVLLLPFSGKRSKKKTKKSERAPVACVRMFCYNPT